MSKLLIINPNSSEASTSMMLKIAQSALQQAGYGREFTVNGYTLSSGPTMLTKPADLDAAVNILINNDQLVQMAQNYDGVIVAAFGDPGLDFLACQLPIPVIGIGESSILEASLYQQPFGIATTTPELADSILTQVKNLNAHSFYTGIRLTVQSPLLLAQQPAQQIEELMQAVEQSIVLDGAQTIIIAGGPLGEAANALKNRFQVTIINPVEAACRRMLNLLPSTKKHDFT